ncbi:M13-type metalloendopeptidase [Aerococcus sp. UMB8623]|uniref:M13 family metallopeptidase n=1 Tax=Aerococcus sp. UMB8623 TaxID=3046348 RepID=UPI00254FAD51|nr:M13-type metalloendopeptidase [Aerococcus sp. UMB8623]MDK6685711.1 M13-type metalloendopeptidase [Aerococcus sp. UMB8623]
MTIDYDSIKDDLYLAVNGDWLAQTEIPADKAATGGFTSLRDQMEDLLLEETQAMRQGEIGLDQPEIQEFVAYYNKALDFEEREAQGSQPLQDEMTQVAHLEDIADFQAFAKDWTFKNNDLPFAISVEADMKDTDHYILYLDAPSLILPDTTYYEEGHEAGQVLLAIFAKQSKELLAYCGIDQADQLTADALAFDRSLARYMKSNEELADYPKLYNPRSLDQVQAYSSHFDFTAYFEAVIGQVPDQVIVTQPAFFDHFDELVNASTFDQVKAWLLVKVVNSASNCLSEEMRQLGSQYSLALSGNPETLSQEKQAFYAATAMFDQVIGLYYGKKHFGPQAREDVRQMVVEMIEVYKQRLEANDWLSPETIAKAIVKLDAIDILVGYPDTYPDIYRQLKVDPELSFYGNLQAFSQIKVANRLGRYGQVVDRTEWGMSPATVNAYYNPSFNHICFPAAILQAPFYAIDQSRSQNYGGIGAVIAHEISHAFDNNGAQFDEKGNMTNWWQEADYEVFNAKAEDMVDQFDGLPFAGGQVNGRLTVSENIADAGGLQAALEACQHEEDYDLQAFFINWARIWCQKARDQYKQLLLSMDVHAPSPLRANVQVKNIDAFHACFDVQEGDPMYLAKENRVVIW